MRKILKWIGIVLGALVVLILLVVAGLYTATTLRLNKRYSYPPSAVTVPTDAASLARGEHLVKSFLACTGCHGDQLQGQEFFNLPPLAVVDTPNLTRGQGGAAATFSDADFVRVLRHGVDPTGRALFVMPSENFTNLSDQDLGAVIAYVKSFPPVDHTSPPPQFLPLGRIMMAAGPFDIRFPVEEIDHTGVRLATTPAVGTPDFGPYLVSIAGCRSCHGSNLAGAKSGDPSSPPAPNLTPAGELGAWSQQDFVNTLRTGTTPSGHKLSDQMPWMYFRNGTDEELAAIYAYLKTVPAVASK